MAYSKICGISQDLWLFTGSLDCSLSQDVWLFSVANTRICGFSLWPTPGFVAVLCSLYPDLWPFSVAHDLWPVPGLTGVGLYPSPTGVRCCHDARTCRPPHDGRDPGEACDLDGAATGQDVPGLQR